MDKKAVFVLAIVGILVFFADLGFGVLAPPFDTPPYDTGATGNSACRNSGGFFVNLTKGGTNFIYWIGTNSTPPGSLMLYFDTPFIDGPGNDFAIRTGGECWGDLADQAEFKFYMADTFIDSFSASLGPNAQFEFDLPGSGMVANRIVITNITPDPPGINDLATMEFLDAGIAWVIREPVIEAAIDIDPNTLDLQSKGKWITCYIWLPEEHNVADIDSYSVLLADEIEAEWMWFEEEEKLAIAKFNRSEVQDILEPGEVELTVSGMLTDGTRFEGTDVIRVIDKGGKE